jgi:hypothetical protein
VKQVGDKAYIAKTSFARHAQALSPFLKTAIETWRSPKLIPQFFQSGHHNTTAGPSHTRVTTDSSVLLLNHLAKELPCLHLQLLSNPLLFPPSHLQHQ